MRKMLAVAAIGLCACGDFVDADGNTSFRQVAEGLQSLGDQVAVMGDALERDADVQAVPWRDLMDVLPDEVDGEEAVDSDGDDAADRNGAGMSIAHREFLVDGDTVFVGVADLGALRSGVGLALRWAAPLMRRDDIERDVEDIRVEGYPGIRIRGDDDDDGVFIALIAEGRFIVAAGAEDRDAEDDIRDALDDVDYDRLEDWEDYGR